MPNDACRLLIMAGLTHGANSYDSYRRFVFLGGEEFRSSLAEPIEQGIGRGARGGGDYFAHCYFSRSDVIRWLTQMIKSFLLGALDQLYRK